MSIFQASQELMKRTGKHHAASEQCSSRSPREDIHCLECRLAKTHLITPILPPSVSEYSPKVQRQLHLHGSAKDVSFGRTRCLAINQRLSEV